MAPIAREQALKNALPSSRMEGLPITEQTLQDCQRLVAGQIDAKSWPPKSSRRKAQKS